MCASAMSIHKQSTVSGNGRARMPCFKKSSLSVQHGATIHAPRRRIFGIWSGRIWKSISRFAYLSSLQKLPPCTNHIQSLNDGSKFNDAGRSEPARSPKVLSKCSRSGFGFLGFHCFCRRKSRKVKTSRSKSCAARSGARGALEVLPKCSRSVF